MSLDMHGGAGEGEGGDDQDGRLVDVFSFMKNNAMNGIAINGLLLWMDVQQKTTPPNILLAQAAATFCEIDVDAARADLWKAAGNRKDLIGEIVAHRSPGKKEKNLEDIHKTMMIIKEKDVLPLLLCTHKMVPNFPAFHSDKDTTNVTDVI